MTKEEKQMFINGLKAARLVLLSSSNLDEAIKELDEKIKFTPIFYKNLEEALNDES